MFKNLKPKNGNADNADLIDYHCQNKGFKPNIKWLLYLIYRPKTYPY